MAIGVRPLPLSMGGDDLEDGLELDPGLVASSNAESPSLGYVSVDDGGELDVYDNDEGEREAREAVVDVGIRKRKAVYEMRVDDAAEKEQKKRRRKQKEKERKAKVSLDQICLCVPHSNSVTQDTDLYTEARAYISCIGHQSAYTLHPVRSILSPSRVDTRNISSCNVHGNR